MTGEMSRSEVTRDRYPDLFQILDNLEKMGASVVPEPFNVYQGPYLECIWKGIGFQIWYGEHPDSFIGKYWVKGKELYYDFHRIDWESFTEHLQSVFLGPLGETIMNLDGLRMTALDEAFNGNIRSFLMWRELGEPHDFEGKPTISEGLQWFTVKISPKNRIDVERLEKVREKVAMILEAELNDFNITME